MAFIASFPLATDCDLMRPGAAASNLELLNYWVGQKVLGFFYKMALVALSCL